jgi:chemotaxis signal transduction protein
LVGLANLRGEILPVVDSAEALGGERVNEPTHLVVVEVARGKAALAATGAPTPIELGEPSGRSERRGGRGRYTLDGDKIASLLDLDALVGTR